jgi:hypothetical protein
MNLNDVLQIVLLGLSGWTLSEVNKLGKKVARIEGRLKIS